MGEGILVVNQLKPLIQLHGLGDEEHLESIKQTLDDSLVIDIATCVNLCPANTVTTLDLLTRSLYPCAGPS